MGKKIKNHDKSITIRLPINLYDELAMCATLGSYHSVSQFVRVLIGSQVRKMREDNGCE